MNRFEELVNTISVKDTLSRSGLGRTANAVKWMLLDCPEIQALVLELEYVLRLRGKSGEAEKKISEALENFKKLKSGAEDV